MANQIDWDAIKQQTNDEEFKRIKDVFGDRSETETVNDLEDIWEEDEDDKTSD